MLELRLHCLGRLEIPIFTKNSPWDTAKGLIPTILAIGDSWFWYPKQNNLLTAWDRNSSVKNDCKSIYLLGYNGADVADYAPGGKYSDDLQHELTQVQFQYYSAFVLSGGGNDAVDGRTDHAADPAFGYGQPSNQAKMDAARMVLGLKDDCTGITNPDECIDEVKVDALLRSISNAVGSVLHDVLWASDRDIQSGSRRYPIQIFLHAYDYPVPDGRGFAVGPLTLIGPWLAPAMQARNVGKGLPPGGDVLGFGCAVARALMTRMRTTIKAYENPARNIFFVDSPGALNCTLSGAYKQDWDNEMHPTGSGFDKIFQTSWLPVLKSAGLAT